MPDFSFDGQVTRVVDGDTCDVRLDLGFDIRHTVRLRLKDVDTHETYGVEKTSKEFEMGKEEQAFVEAWLSDAREYDGEWPLTIETESARAGIYGRYTATIERKIDGASLTEDLVDEYPDVNDPL